MREQHRHRLAWMVAIVAIAGIGAPTLLAEQVSPLDVPTTGEFRVIDARSWTPCYPGIALEHVARTARAPIGFENELGCGDGERRWSVSSYRRDIWDNSWDFSGATAREAIEQLLALAPAYRGVEQNGIFVVRPTRSWDDSGDILNRPVQSFSVKDAGIKDVVRVLLESATPSLFPAVPGAAIQYVWRPGQRVSRHQVENGLLPAADPRPPAPIEHPITITFAGGTLLQALNALAVQQHLNWQIGYIQTPGQVRAQVILSDVALWPSGGMASTLTTPLAGLP